MLCLGGGGLGGGSKITFLGVKLDFKLSSELVLLAKLNLIFQNYITNKSNQARGTELS